MVHVYTSVVPNKEKILNYSADNIAIYNKL